MTPDLPDPVRLRLLADIAHHGSISAAARVHGITPSAVSQHMSALERSCGTPLLERLPKGAHLTAAGELLAERGRALLRILEAARADIDAFDDRLAGRIRVATIASAAHAIVLPALATLAAEHPRLDPTLTVEEPNASIRALGEGRTDIALIDTYDHVPVPLPGNVHATEILVEPLVVISSSPLDAKAKLADLADCRWVIPPESAACGQAVRHACRRAGFEPNVRWQTDDLELLSVTVAAGHGITLLPRLVIEVAERELHSHHPPDASLTRRIAAVVRGGEQRRPAVRAVVETLRTRAMEVDAAPPER